VDFINRFIGRLIYIAYCRTKQNDIHDNIKKKITLFKLMKTSGNRSQVAHKRLAAFGYKDARINYRPLLT